MAEQADMLDVVDGNLRTGAKLAAASIRNQPTLDHNTLFELLERETKIRVGEQLETLVTGYGLVTLDQLLHSCKFTNDVFDYALFRGIIASYKQAFPNSDEEINEFVESFLYNHGLFKKWETHEYNRNAVWADNCAVVFHNRVFTAIRQCAAMTFGWAFGCRKWLT